ncbi:FAD/NAD(P)-binding domain-containing protein [Trichoderma longibrachiatum ATCC 18648]|uniref:FAD/NAD(P)-binding domain-containing protein n=1 Tax=Trichoderma longibrachiatum ATCC 18648 TaxID=983965 RepID=A0A2T4BX50_TRILO|nr:FAD/NAD(P)-binding domain-containing protein [Trichoderma longibrachiatum ATCC 18648]
METIDCVVAGAGWYGLAAAKQYRVVSPNDSLVIFDPQATVGGTWADERLYPDVKSNNLLGTYEYPDFPMDPKTFGIKPGQYIPGEVINAYLKAYVDKFNLGPCLRLRTKITAAEHHDTAEGGWTLTVVNDEGHEYKVFARRLIVATGLTSEPFMPHFDGQEEFGGRIFHSKYFKQNRDTLETSKAVTVYGGTKFGWDAAYSYAMAGVEVNWVIRSSGHGPCWIAPSYVTPFKKWIEKLANIRFLTWFSPCIYSGAAGYTSIQRFLHGTPIGRALVNAFWAILGGDVLSLNNYDAHSETAKLKPWTPAMFTAASFSILNYDADFFALVRDGKIKVHIAEIDHLGPGTVHLADGTSFASDAFVCNTGWKTSPPITFLPAGIDRELGLPHAIDTEAPPEDLANQQDLLRRADADIAARFPRLRDQPVWNKHYVPLTQQKGISTADPLNPYAPQTPFMLYRFLVPPSERFLRPRDVAFSGFVSNFSNTLCAHLQGLWIGAYFRGLLADDLLRRALADDGDDAMRRLRYETVLHNRFGKWRYPTETKAPTTIFDAVYYLDLLQKDLGLDPRRKPKGFLTEVTSPYGAEDYRDVNDEWESKVGRVRAE